MVALENDRLRVWLDAGFPRVLRYLWKEGEGTLHGSPPDAPKTVEVNGLRFGERLGGGIEPGRIYRVYAEFGEDSATYAFRVWESYGSVSFEIVFQLAENVLEVRLQNVVERGGFRLRTLYFPHHALLTVRKAQDGASICRAEFRRNPWDFPKGKARTKETGKGLIRWKDVYTGPLEGLQPEDSPEPTHWAMVYTDKVVGTLQNNIPVFPIHTQATGNGSTTESTSIWNGIYHYRVKDEITPSLLCRIALLGDMNGDGRVDWMDGAIWLRNQLPDANPLYDGAFVYKILCCRLPDHRFPETYARAPEPTVYATFDQCLEIIRKVHFLTNGARQIVYLVGWQHEGHDSKYPDLTVVNQLLGGREKLVALIEEAKKFNAIVSLHVNFDDAYTDSPAWDPDIICTSPNGRLVEWQVFHDMMSYHISHYKDVKKGSALKRIDDLLELLPIEHTIHCDAFRYTNESWDPDGHIDMTTELVLGCQKIIDRFAQHGVDVTIESFGSNPALAGRITGFGGYGAPYKLTRFIMHRKWLIGGKNAVEMVFGLKSARNFNGDYVSKTPTGTICDRYYLLTLLYHHLRRREMTAISDDGNRLVFEYGKSCAAVYDRNTGEFHVTSDGITIARDDSRFIPVSDHEILAYSKKAGLIEWKLPSGWSEKDNIQMFMLTETGRRTDLKFKIEHDKIIFHAEPQRPYLITRMKTESNRI